MIAIRCCNLAFYIFWERIFVDLGLSMNKDRKSFLEQKDKHKLYRKEHQKKVETKRQQVNRKNRQIKEMMEKIDEARGDTNRIGVAIETDIFQIPTTIKEIEKTKIGDESRLSLGRLLQTLSQNNEIQTL